MKRVNTVGPLEMCKSIHSFLDSKNERKYSKMDQVKYLKNI